MSMIARLSPRTLYLLLWQHSDEKNSNKYKKRFWVRQIFLDREKKGAFNMLVKDLSLFDNEYFFSLFRMTPTKYEDLLMKLAAPKLTKDSLRGSAIEPSKRVTVTLKYIFAGTSQIDLSGMFRPPLAGSSMKHVQFFGKFCWLRILFYLLRTNNNGKKNLNANGIFNITSELWMGSILSCKHQLDLDHFSSTIWQLAMKTVNLLF